MSDLIAQLRADLEGAHREIERLRTLLDPEDMDDIERMWRKIDALTAAGKLMREELDYVATQQSQHAAIRAFDTALVS